MKIYTKEELSLRNGQSLPEIWIAYKGKIYDVTNSTLFKGGKHFKLSTGIDLTNQIDNAPHTDELLNDFTVVGFLKD